MSRIERSSPLAKAALKGRYGADTVNPGVTISILASASLVLVMARAGMEKSVENTLSKLANARTMWAGAGQWYVQGPSQSALSEHLAGLASSVDQSHGRVTFAIAGHQSKALLAKGTPVDLHTDHFPIGKSVLTQMAHVGVHLTRNSENDFELSVFRGFAESFWEWLTEMALEFGYEVT